MRRFTKTLALFASCFLLFGSMVPVVPVHAAEETVTKEETKTYHDDVWLRARVAYKVSKMVTKQSFTDATIEISSDKWQKNKDGWYYYKDKVKPDQTIEFMKSFSVPASITEVDSDKEFGVEIEAQIAEAVAEHPGWDKNENGVYAETYDTISKKYTDEIKGTSEKDGVKKETNMKFEQGTTVVKINEYEDYGNGVQEYEDKQTVLPGQKISKIVYLTISGTPGKATKTTKTTSPKKEEPKSTPTPTPAPNRETVTYTPTSDFEPIPETTSALAEPAPEPENEVPVSTPAPDPRLVKTDDDAPIVPLIVTAGLALSGIVGILIYKKKGEKA